MEYRQLYYFVCVAKEGNFTRAAEKLMISEPSLSKAIKRLEEELGGEFWQSEVPDLLY